MYGALAAPRVQSATELRQVMRQAHALVRVDASQLDRVLRLDAGNGLVEVQAGASWCALASFLRPTAPEVVRAWELAASSTARIGASVDTNAAGPDGRPVISHIEAIAIVTPDGELRRVARDTGNDLFSLVVGGQGLFGATYSVTLRLDSLAQTACAALAPTRLEASPREPRFKRLRLLVPPQQLEPFLEAARARCAEWHTSMHALKAKRVLPERETLLAWANREYAELTLAVEELPVLGACVRATQLKRELIDLAIAHGGSFPIARSPEATRAQVDACYPALRGFLAAKRRHDPGEKIINAWYQHHRSLLGRETCEVRWGG
jgi:FAD/FMN-containing dehydrogenase